MIRLWCKVGAAWYAWTCTRDAAADIMARLGGRVGRWAVDSVPRWPVVDGEPPARLERFGGNDSGIRAAIAGWPDVCTTCGDDVTARPWGPGRIVWTGHGPECAQCAARYAD